MKVLIVCISCLVVIYLVGASQQNRRSQSATVAVDSQLTASPKLDKYGGVLAAPSPKGPSGWFRTEKRGNRWLLVTPAGNYYFGLGMYSVFPTGPMKAKYGDADISAMPSELQRIVSWGFNGTGPYSSPWAMPTAVHPKWPGDHTQPLKVPTVQYLKVGYYALFNANNYAPQAVLDLIAGVAPTASLRWRGDPLPDVFSPYFETYVAGMVKAQMIISPWIIGYMSDDPGFMWGFGAGRLYPSTPAGHENDMLGYTTLLTAPTQASNTNCALRRITCTYRDPQNHSKSALASFLQAKYGTIAVMNAAWSSTYTSFGSNGGFGVGTGLLDESGVMGHKWVGRDGVALSDFPANVASDLEAFSGQFAAKYFSVCRKHFKQKWPNGIYFGLMSTGSWNTIANPEVLQGAKGNVDYIALQIDPTAPTAASELAMIQQNAGDVPLMTSTYLYANKDSAMWRCPALGYPTQELRAQAYQRWVDAAWSIAYPDGTHPLSFLLFWQLADKPSECGNEGLISPSDNAYDGVQDQVAASLDPLCFRNYPAGQKLCSVARGGEEKNYGNSVSGIAAANQSIFSKIASAVP
jgi:hypothetical protein